MFYGMGDVNKKSGYLVAWKHACRSKADGGLGIIDLRAHNVALLMKFLHKFYNRADLPWVDITWTHFYRNSRPPRERKNDGSFWWCDIMSLAPKFLQMAKCTVRSGSSVSFWHDPWDLGILKDIYQQLSSFSRNKSCSVLQLLSWDESRAFFLPLSQIAFDQLCALKETLLALQLPSSGADVWTYTWGSDFSSHWAYITLQGSHPASHIFKWMWVSKAQHKPKFFFWLFLRDRTNTRNLLHKKNIFLPSYSCDLCVQHVEEDVRHLFFGCPFSYACWTYLGVDWDLNLDFQAMVLNARLHFNSIIFREVFIFRCWAIWCHHNDIIFDGASLSFLIWKRFFVKKLKAVALRAKPRVRDKLNLFLCSLL
jgi:hypothetical protein